MYETHNDLPVKTREQMIELLNARLADAVDLRTRIKTAHWNLKGWSFIGLHELCDDIAKAVDDYADLIGERTAQLGGVSRGTAGEVATRTSLSEFSYPTEEEQKSYVEALARSLSGFARATRAAIDIAAKTGDQVTSDIFIGISRGTDKWLWFIEAHEQGRGAEAVEQAIPRAGKAEELPLQH
jgi:starvation-inducible DNA-binding protein